MDILAKCQVLCGCGTGEGEKGETLNKCTEWKLLQFFRLQDFNHRVGGDIEQRQAMNKL